MLIKLTKLNNLYVNTDYITRVKQMDGQIVITLIDGSQVFTDEITIEELSEMMKNK